MTRNNNLKISNKNLLEENERKQNHNMVRDKEKKVDLKAIKEEIFESMNPILINNYEEAWEEIKKNTFSNEFINDYETNNSIEKYRQKQIDNIIFENVSFSDDKILYGLYRGELNTSKHSEDSSKDIETKKIRKKYKLIEFLRQMQANPRNAKRKMFIISCVLGFFMFTGITSCSVFMPYHENLACNLGAGQGICGNLNDVYNHIEEKRKY